MERRPQTPTKWKGDVFFNAGLASDRHIDRPGFVRLQLEDVGCGAAGELLWDRVKQHRRTEPFAIEALVVQCNLALADVEVCDAPASATESPHFEEVGKVAAERDRKPDVKGAIAVVVHAQTLIGDTAQKKKGTHDVQHVFRLAELLIKKDVGIRQIDDKDGVVVADVRTQQQGLRAVEQYFEVRQIAGVAKEDAVGPARRCADVGVTVEHGEAVALLEGAAGPCRGSRPGDVERGLRSLLDQRFGRAWAKQSKALGRWHARRPAMHAGDPVRGGRRLSSMPAAYDRRGHNPSPSVWRKNAARTAGAPFSGR